jgi:lipid-A-disaccharide synthase-like uncharacterized protein
MTAEQLWIGIGLLAQALFGVRVLVQWRATERQRASVIPPMYWYLSLAGGTLLLAYAVYRLDSVFIAGEAVTLMIFARNVYFLRRSRTEHVCAICKAPLQAESRHCPRCGAAIPLPRPPSHRPPDLTDVVERPKRTAG